MRSALLIRDDKLQLFPKRDLIISFPCAYIREMISDTWPRVRNK